MMKFWLAGVIAAALTVSMVAFSDGGTPTVYADPDVGACGNDFIDVPDTGLSFNFVSACESHDDCYSVPGTEATRKACDDAFLADMKASCSAMWPSQFLKRLACNSVAGTYFLGVRLGGWAYYPYL